jgi:phytoene dehydrogenase-like protein
MGKTDAVVVGTGPNGLAAAITLARAGVSVQVIEGAAEPGGGCRTAELTLPGFLHDVCAAVHPLAAASPFFQSLAGPGPELLHPPVALAHPLDGLPAAALTGTVAQTASLLGADAAAYRALLGPIARDLPLTLPAILGPVLARPARPFALARFGLPGALPATVLARRFRTPQARALLAGAAAHAMLPLTAPLTSAFALLLLAIGHQSGWPFAAGGSGAVTGVLTRELAALGGELETGRWIRDLSELTPARIVLLDVAPAQLATMAGPALPPPVRRRLARFRQGPGACKVDWALSGPVPWRDAVCRQAGTVHVGGTLQEIAASEAEVAGGRHARQPFCIVAQPCVADQSRAPAGRHTLWGYCHVPAGSERDVSGLIEAQIERFAPGFRDLILARSVRTAADLERYNPGYVGGDIGGGAATLRQVLLGPARAWRPYESGLPGVYLCSAATPPGGGVHGRCGEGAARAALAWLGTR